MREALFYACAEARTPILMLKPANFSLEEIFLELTQQADAAPAGAEAEGQAPGEPGQPADESEGDVQ